jgi:hypothetical protein
VSGNYDPARTDRQPDLVVTPAPTDEELAAIVAAVTMWSQRRSDPGASAPLEGAQPSRWAMAGRREATRGLDRDERTATTR